MEQAQELLVQINVQPEHIVEPEVQVAQTVVPDTLVEKVPVHVQNVEQERIQQMKEVPHVQHVQKEHIMLHSEQKVVHLVLQEVIIIKQIKLHVHNVQKECIVLEELIQRFVQMEHIEQLLEEK